MFRVFFPLKNFVFLLTSFRYSFAIQFLSRTKKNLENENLKMIKDACNNDGR